MHHTIVNSCDIKTWKVKKIVLVVLWLLVLFFTILIRFDQIGSNLIKIVKKAQANKGESAQKSKSKVHAISQWDPIPSEFRHTNFTTPASQYSAASFHPVATGRIHGAPLSP